jgi:hypothetical protein
MSSDSSGPSGSTHCIGDTTRMICGVVWDTRRHNDGIIRCHDVWHGTKDTWRCDDASEIKDEMRQGIGYVMMPSLQQPH